VHNNCIAATKAFDASLENLFFLIVIFYDVSGETNYNRRSWPIKARSMLLCTLSIRYVARVALCRINHRSIIFRLSSSFSRVQSGLPPPEVDSLPLHTELGDDPAPPLRPPTLILWVTSLRLRDVCCSKLRT
jgi:hypothetical protein